jgi:hypothetical protein
MESFYPKNASFYPKTCIPRNLIKNEMRKIAISPCLWFFQASCGLLLMLGNIFKVQKVKKVAKHLKLGQYIVSYHDTFISKT